MPTELYSHFFFEIFVTNSYVHDHVRCHCTILLHVEVYQYAMA